jgi:flagellar motor switch protein FliN/FliY
MAQVLAQIAGAACGVECPEPAPPDAPPPAEGDLQVMVTAAGAVRGEMALRLPRTAALAMGQLLLGENRDPGAEFKPDHGEAAEELLRQVAGHAATALKARWGEVQLSVAAGAAPSWPPAATGWMCSSPGAAFLFCLEWQLSAALVAGLRPAPEVAASAPAPVVAVDAKLDRLMDVELDVTLRFGGRRMLLRDILELSAGSVMELDRQVNEPADLLLDGRLIARGEVVVVDGSYGLRVTELVAPQVSG